MTLAILDKASPSETSFSRRDLLMRVALSMSLVACTGGFDDPDVDAAFVDAAFVDGAVRDAAAVDSAAADTRMDVPDAGPVAADASIVDGEVRPDVVENALCPRATRMPRAGGLSDIASETGRLMGTAVAAAAYESDEDYRRLLHDEFAFVTAENVMKWGQIEGELGNASYDAADAFVREACLAGQTIRGHALLWHSDVPTGLDALSPMQLRDEIQRHIAATVSRYEGIVAQWDVVNEAIDDASGFRRSVFFETLGESYIADAFRSARDAAPTADLGYNDYGILGGGAKADRVYAMVEGLLAAGVPIDYVGMQGHVTAGDATGGWFDEDQLRANIARFVALGVDVYITELDVRVRGLVGDVDAAQRESYRRIVSACAETDGCRGVTTWGFTDRYSWIDEFFGEDDALLYDEDLMPKPAYMGVVDGFRGAPAAGELSPCSVPHPGALVCDGFETAVGWGPTENGGTVAYTAGAARRGNFGVDARVGGTGPGRQALLGRVLPQSYRDGDLYLQAHVQLPGARANVNTVFSATERNPPYAGVSFNVSSGAAEIYATTENRGQRGGAIGGGWHCVQLHLQLGAGRARLRIDGVEQVNMAVRTVPAAGLGSVSLGVLYASDDGGGRVLIDDFIVSRSPTSCN